MTQLNLFQENNKKEEHNQFQNYFSKKQKELEEAIKSYDTKKTYSLSQELGITYEDGPIKTMIDEGEMQIMVENKETIDDFVTQKIEPETKEERIKKYLKEGEQYYTRGGFFNEEQIKNIAKEQTKVLIKYFPKKFNESKPVETKQGIIYTKTIRDLFNESPRKVNTLYNNVYEFYSKKYKTKK